MKRSELLQGIRTMKFAELYERASRRELSQDEAASILGVSERTFRRWRDRCEAEGAEGTMSTFAALHEVIGEHGLFCALCADRGSHYWHTPEAGGKVDKDNPTQVGRALKQLGIELMAAYSPEARGRSERMFGTLQKRLPQELRLARITTMEEANRFLRETFVAEHNQRFAIKPGEPGSAFVPFAGSLKDTLCVQDERVVGNDNTVRYKNLVLQIPEDRHRHHYVKARVRAHHYPDGTLAVFHGPRRLATYDENGTLNEKANSMAA